MVPSSISGVGPRTSPAPAPHPEPAPSPPLAPATGGRRRPPTSSHRRRHAPPGTPSSKIPRRHHRSAPRLILIPFPWLEVAMRRFMVEATRAYTPEAIARSLACPSYETIPQGIHPPHRPAAGVAIATTPPHRAAPRTPSPSDNLPTASRSRKRSAFATSSISPAVFTRSPAKAPVISAEPFRLFSLPDTGLGDAPLVLAPVFADEEGEVERVVKREGRRELILQGSRCCLRCRPAIGRGAYCSSQV